MMYHYFYKTYLYLLIIASFLISPFVYREFYLLLEYCIFTVQRLFSELYIREAMDAAEHLLLRCAWLGLD